MPASARQTKVPGPSLTVQDPKASVVRGLGLTIGSHGDEREREAERAAGRTLAAPSGPGTALPGFSAPAAGSELAPPSVHSALEDSGYQLAVATRLEMQSHFGHDFSHVRVHTGEAAARSAAEMNASAYTVGNNIVLGARVPTLESDAGRHLIAHELAHVIQQTRLPTTNYLVQRQLFAPPPQAGGFNRPYQQDVDYLVHTTPVESERRRTAREEERTWDEVLKPFKDAIKGEWEQDPSTAGMLLDTSLGLIPIVDQGLDLRDIIAHIYMLSGKREYNNPMRWVGLALTLIGVVPEVGSAVKGVAKIAIKKGAKALDKLVEPLSAVAKVSSNITELATIFRNTMKLNWSLWVTKSKSAFDQCIAVVEGFLKRVGDSAHDRIAKVQKIKILAAAKLDEAFDKLKREIEDALDALTPQPALAGGPAHVPHLKDGTAVGPKVKGKKKPRVEDPSHPSGSRRIPSKPKGQELPQRLDLEDIPRLSGETAREALKRTQRVCGQRLRNLPGLVAEWKQARKDVLKTVPKPNNKEEARSVFEKVRTKFWERVEKHEELKAYFESSGFEFPGGGRSPQLKGVRPDIPDAEKTISLDHDPINLADDFTKALDPNNLKMEMASANSWREVTQMRHPNLK